MVDQHLMYDIIAKDAKWPRVPTVILCSINLLTVLGLQEILFKIFST